MVWHRENQCPLSAPLNQDWQAMTLGAGLHDPHLGREDRRHNRHGSCQCLSVSDAYFDGSPAPVPAEGAYEHTLDGELRSCLETAIGRRQAAPQQGDKHERLRWRLD